MAIAQGNISRRVVVTGLGAVTCLGLDMAQTWAALCEGRSGIGPITRFDASLLPARIAGEVKGFAVEKYLSSKEARKVGLFAQYALAAAREALDSARLPQQFAHSPLSRRTGISISSGMGGMPEIQHWDRELATKEKKSISPFFVPMIIPNMASGYLSIVLGAKGPNTCVVTACASSSHAIGESARYIKNGDADVMIAGGTEAVICELGIAGFTSMKALSTRNDDPTAASRPYDKDRDGFVMSEGSVVLILEEREHAIQRGATVLAELVGYGLNGDAYHMTSPAPEGAGAAECMALALENAGMNPDAIDYVNTHGTSTPVGDSLEALAVARVFAGNKAQLSVSSTKSMTGHMLGAAGAMEAAVCVLAVKNDIVPPTINLHQMDDETASTGLNLTANKAVRRTVRAALSNSFGFGGTNASLIFKKHH